MSDEIKEAVKAAFTECMAQGPVITVVNQKREIESLSAEILQCVSRRGWHHTQVDTPQIDAFCDRVKTLVKEYI